jgi:hypothetical protein
MGSMRRPGCAEQLYPHSPRSATLKPFLLTGHFRRGGPSVTALSQLSNSDPHNLWSSLAEADFLDLPHSLRAEVEQY